LIFGSVYLVGVKLSFGAVGLMEVGAVVVVVVVAVVVVVLMIVVVTIIYSSSSSSSSSSSISGSSSSSCPHVSCPHVKCRGWNVCDKLPASRHARITCGVCERRRPVVEWRCFTCNMTEAMCICNLPEQSDRNRERKRPARRGLPRASPKRSKRQ
jgi:hypothetical protein